MNHKRAIEMCLCGRFWGKSYFHEHGIRRKSDGRIGFSAVRALRTFLANAVSRPTNNNLFLDVVGGQDFNDDLLLSQVRVCGSKPHGSGLFHRPDPNRPRASDQSEGIVANDLRRTVHC